MQYLNKNKKLDELLRNKIR